MNKQDYIYLYDRDLKKVIAELEAYSNPEEIWLVQTGISNSAGHLAQHLIGNLKTFLCLPLGEFSYIRDREAEFNSIRFSFEDLIKELHALRVELSASLEKIPDLDAIYPKEIKEVYDGEQTIGFMLSYLLIHLAYHTGQINYHRRLLGAAVIPVQK